MFEILLQPRGRRISVRRRHTLKESKRNDHYCLNDFNRVLLRFIVYSSWTFLGSTRLARLKKEFRGKRTQRHSRSQRNDEDGYSIYISIYDILITVLGKRVQFQIFSDHLLLRQRRKIQFPSRLDNIYNEKGPLKIPFSKSCPSTLPQ